MHLEIVDTFIYVYIFTTLLAGLLANSISGKSVAIICSLTVSVQMVHFATYIFGR